MYGSRKGAQHFVGFADEGRSKYIYFFLFHKLVEKDAAPRGLICFTSSNQSRFKLNFLKAYQPVF